MKKIISISAILICFGLSLPTSASADTLQQLKDCARTQNDQQRIACYEALGKAVLAADSQVSNEASSAASKPEVQNSEPSSEDLPASIGGGKYARDAGVPEEQYSGALKSCKKAIDKRWFYIFENGQVWKQVQHKKIRHKHCNVNATLTKDGFGYIMVIDGEERKVRVRRHR